MTKNLGNLLSLATVLIITFSLSAVSLERHSAPFVWLGLTWLVFLVFLIWQEKRIALKIILINLTAVIVVLTSFETYLWLTKEKSNARFAGIYDNYYQTKHPVLGYAPHKNIVRPSARKYKGEQLVYNVRYTIDNNGLRKSSNSPYKTGNKCLILFGGSFTFGEGINDDETTAFHAGYLLGNTYNIYNFGLHGYGPHQMLSALEHGLVDKIAKCEKDTHIIYQSMYSHINRSAGLSSWGRHDPRYQLDSDGIAVFTGHFDDGFNSSPIAKKLEKSLLYANIFGINRAVTEKDTELFLAIVEKSRLLAKELFPNSTFHIIHWHNDSDKDNELQAAFLSHGINNYMVSEILPGYSENKEMYKIKHDGHPNALAHSKIAQFVAGNIMSGSWLLPTAYLE